LKFRHSLQELKEGAKWHNHIVEGQKIKTDPKVDFYCRYILLMIAFIIAGICGFVMLKHQHWHNTSLANNIIKILQFLMIFILIEFCILLKIKVERDIPKVEPSREILAEIGHIIEYVSLDNSQAEDERDEIISFVTSKFLALGNRMITTKWKAIMADRGVALCNEGGYIFIVPWNEFEIIPGGQAGEGYRLMTVKKPDGNISGKISQTSFEKYKNRAGASGTTYRIDAGEGI